MATKDLGYEDEYEEPVNIEFNPKKVDMLRTRTLPESDYKLHKSVNFNGLKITYVGTIKSVQGERDVIIVEFHRPYLKDTGGRLKKTQSFYRSTGTNSSFKNTWFPFNGIVAPLTWWDKGGSLKQPLVVGRRRLSGRTVRIASIKEGGNSPLFYEFEQNVLHKGLTRNAYRTISKRIQEIFGRFQYDKFFEISLILGGGKLWEDDEEAMKLRDLYFRNKDKLIKKTYDIPSVRIYIDPIQINSIIGPSTEYGIKINYEFFRFQKELEPFVSIIPCIVGMREQKIGKIKELYEFLEKIQKRSDTTKKYSRVGYYEPLGFGEIKGDEQKIPTFREERSQASHFGQGGGFDSKPIHRRNNQRSVDYDSGLPARNILWIYSITTKGERATIISLLKQIYDDDEEKVFLDNTCGSGWNFPENIFKEGYLKKANDVATAGTLYHKMYYDKTKKKMVCCKVIDLTKEDPEIRTTYKTSDSGGESKMRGGRRRTKRKKTRRRGGGLSFNFRGGKRSKKRKTKRKKRRRKKRKSRRRR